MEYDCQSCGACCVGLDVVLDEQDLDRFESESKLLSLTVLHRRDNGTTLRFMKRVGNQSRCAALRGPLHDCRCAIYRERPDVCREFTPGSSDCLEARNRHGYVSIERDAR